MIHRLAKVPRIIILGVITLLLGLPHPSSAQPLQPGDRIRVIRQGGVGSALIGRLVRATQDSVWFRPLEQGHTVGVGLGPGARLDRSLGRRSHAGTGALIGAGVGAAITVFFLSAFCGGDTLCNGDEQVRAAAIFGLPSVAIGAGIGALIKVERWVPVPRDAVGAAARLRIGIQVVW